MAKKAADKNQMLLDIPGVLYDARFLESHAGKHILHDPKIAIVELIANAWDAGTTEVKIDWPGGTGTQNFAMQDNGNGMTDEEFKGRWRKLNYNRETDQGRMVTFPAGSVKGQTERVAFGRNGIGRWSGFCFGDTYIVDTSKSAFRNRYEVSRGLTEPFEIKQKLAGVEAKTHGTKIECPNCRQV